MPLPDPSELCVHLDLHTGLPEGAVTFDPFSLNVSMPGGVKLEAQFTAATRVPAVLLGQLNTALAPLQPIFDIVDFALAAKKVFDAVKTLNGVKIASAVATLPPYIDKFATLVPALSVPALIRSILQVNVAFLDSVVLDLDSLNSAELAADAAEARATLLGSTELATIVGCARERNAVQLNVMVRQAEPFNRLVAILNILCGIVGLPPLPALDVASGVTVAGYRAVAVDLQAALRRVAELLPV